MQQFIIHKIGKLFLYALAFAVYLVIDLKQIMGRIKLRRAILKHQWSPTENFPKHPNDPAEKAFISRDGSLIITYKGVRHVRYPKLWSLNKSNAISALIDDEPEYTLLFSERSSSNSVSTEEFLKGNSPLLKKDSFPLIP